MKIKNIKIYRFGCLKDLNLDLSAGVNVISGNNESGKSTLLAFVRSVFYGFDSRVSDNPRKKYLPWGSNPEDRFGGEISFTHKEKSYKAVAVFTQSKRTDNITLYNDVTGEVIPIPEGNTIGEYILGLSAGAFDCSVFAAQLDSKGDFTRDKNGQLFTKLSSSSDFSEDSARETNRRLKKAIHRITNRTGSGILDKLNKKSEDLHSMLNFVENNQAQVSQLSSELEQLTEDEEKLNNRRNYYIQFSEIKNAFNTLENRKLILHKQREIKDIETDMESLNATMDPSLYDDIKPKISGLFIFLFLITLLLFGAGVFATIYSFLLKVTFYYVLGFASVTLLFLLLSIICLIKIRKAPVIPTDIEGNFDHLDALNAKLETANLELEEKMGGMTWEELEVKWQTAADYLQSAELSGDTLKYIQHCPPETISEKTEAATNELMEIRQRISYVKGNIDSISNFQQKPEETDIYVAISETEAQIKYYNDKLNALYLAQSVLEQSVEELQNTFGPVINRYTNTYLAAITNKDYGKIKMTSDFKISVFDEKSLSAHSSSDYSGATEDQFYLALRFALASLVASDGAVLPLYLDDPFVQYDDERFNNALAFIREFTEKNNSQIILATCHSRDLSPLGEYNTLKL